MGQIESDRLKLEYIGQRFRHIPTDLVRGKNTLHIRSCKIEAVLKRVSHIRMLYLFLVNNLGNTCVLSWLSIYNLSRPSSASLLVWVVLTVPLGLCIQGQMSGTYGSGLLWPRSQACQDSHKTPSVTNAHWV